MRQQFIEALAAQLVNSANITYDEIEKIAKKYNISPISLFLAVNDALIRRWRPDIWETLESLDSDGDLEDEVIE